MSEGLKAMTRCAGIVTSSPVLGLRTDQRRHDGKVGGKVGGRAISTFSIGGLTVLVAGWVSRPFG
jgi:hypothetical protein